MGESAAAAVAGLADGGVVLLENLRFNPGETSKDDAERGAFARALAAGARDFLSKPLDNLEVLLRIGNLLETRQLNLQLREHNRRLEEVVQQRTRTLREQAELMDLASDAMLVCDAQGRLVYWNRGAERL